MPKRKLSEMSVTDVLSDEGDLTALFAERMKKLNSTLDFQRIVKTPSRERKGCNACNKAEWKYDDLVFENAKSGHREKLCGECAVKLVNRAAANTKAPKATTSSAIASQPPSLYSKSFIEKGDNRDIMFRNVANAYKIKSALYAGSYVHICPSFSIPHVVYVDSDKRIPKFFNDPLLLPYIESMKKYTETPSVSYHHQNYNSPLKGVKKESFDLLISQYAGFISPKCKQYLKVGGILLTNDSHGDASMANIDPDFKLIAAVSNEYEILDTYLDTYFVLKKTVEVTEALLKEQSRGMKYTKPMYSYIFRKVLSK